MITQEQKDAIVKAAREVLENDYAKQNKAVYSAAVLTSSGEIYPAVSFFSDTYTLTAHGEQAALIHAAAHGEGAILAIAVASLEEKKLGEFTNPCHMCKQLLYESQKRNNLPMLVILSNNHGEIQEVELSEMISYPWPV